MIYAEYLNVAVDLPVNTTYTYGVSKSLAHLVSEGKRVLVPFGSRRLTGYILGPADPSGQENIKGVIDILDDVPLFPAAMIPFFQWVSEYYHYPIGSVIKNALPGGLNIQDIAVVEITSMGRDASRKSDTTAIEKKILSVLGSGPCRLKDLKRQLPDGVPQAVIQILCQKKWIVSQRVMTGTQVKPRKVRYVSFNPGVETDKALSPVKKKILTAIEQHREITVAGLKEMIPRAPAHINALKEMGYLSIFYRTVYRDPLGVPINPDSPPQLNTEQQLAVDRILENADQEFSTFLLDGVTGSGKTEVYMQVTEKVLQQGRTVLVLVPEIALIAQTARRFRARFGEKVAVLHSGLTAGERYDQWMRIVQEQAVIAIGARSAIFAPLSDIGLIVVDEEHDGSYKQEGGLRYNARDLAVVRAKQCRGIALLGSATPSVQSHYNVTTRKFIGLQMTHRVEQRPLPDVAIVDLRDSSGISGIDRNITPTLRQAMLETLERGEQVLLFLNRRGYSSYPVCASCGASLKCKNCDISLTLHLRSNAYKCHYCGFTRAAVSRCPACGSEKIKRLGLGTEKLEENVRQLFPNAEIARMDRDTTNRKGAVLKFLKGLKNRTIDILIGTQMVAKGHDFPHITLVGIICADLSLNFPDFRAAERTYQLLAQVSGRAGRGTQPGRVILQTYNPEHYSIEYAKSQDFRSFYEREIADRHTLNYPPFTRMIQLKISGKDRVLTRQHAETVGQACHDISATVDSSSKEIQILGPIEFSVPKIAGRFRWQILLKARSVKKLHALVHHLTLDYPVVMNYKAVRVVVDVDPYMMI